jgi:hypothetical protein
VVGVEHQLSVPYPNRREVHVDLMDLRLEDLAKEIGSGRRVADEEVEREGGEHGAALRSEGPAGYHTAGGRLPSALILPSDLRKQADKEPATKHTRFTISPSKRSRQIRLTNRLRGLVLRHRL